MNKPVARYHPQTGLWRVTRQARVEGLDTPIVVSYWAATCKLAWELSERELQATVDLAEILVACDKAIQETFTPKWWRWITSLFKK